MTPYPIIVALDDMDRERAIALAKSFFGHVWGFKIHSLIDQYGPSIIDELKPFGKIFLDIKLHDIPTTVGLRVKACLSHNADYISVHASSGSKALTEAVTYGGERIVAITKLTSETEGDGVEELAEVAYNSGVRTFVCSPHEVKRLKQKYSDSTVICPGIRSMQNSSDDQSRTMSPQDALKEGADLLVIGRPITKAENPQTALEALMS